MGVYKITNITHSDRPVWQSTVRDDRYLFYRGNNMKWIVNDKVDENTGAFIKSKKKGLVYLPARGWKYSISHYAWSLSLDDDTLTVTGKHISCVTFN